MTPRVWRAAADRWNRFWFEPAPALNLAAARVVFALHAMWVVLSRDLAATTGVPAVFWTGVAVRTRWRFLYFPGHPSLESGLETLAIVTLAAAAIGIFPRLACFVSAVLLYHLAPFETLFWTPNPFERGLTVSVLALSALAFSRCGDALCLFPRRAGPSAPSPDYGWPLRLVQLQLCQVYFIAGYAKLRLAGFMWPGPSNMRQWFLLFSQIDQMLVPTSLGVWIANHPIAALGAGLGGLALDLGLIVMVFWPKLRVPLIAAALAFHTAIILTMGILFLNIPQFLIFVNWDALRRARRRDARPAAVHSDSARGTVALPGA